jgi:hypothetical protein
MGHPQPVRELVNKAGILSLSGLLNFDVFFDLLELPDSVDGVKEVLLAGSRLTLKGGGIEASIFLHGCDSFGVIGPIKDLAEEAA